jgi:hypothetical protein
MLVKDGDTLTLGGTTLRFYHHPGHTPGVLWAEFTGYDNGVPHNTLWQGGGGYRGGLAEAEEALMTANRLAQMPGIEVLVMIHSWADARMLFLMDRHSKPGDDGNSWTGLREDTRKCGRLGWAALLFDPATA